MRTTTQAATNWFESLRFGMFVHFGLYSLLARGEWVRNREQIPREDYARLAKEFTADRYDADEICDLAVRAGMRYIVLTTMHHDGFRLYDTALSDFSTVRTAAGRDLVNETIVAARRRGLRIGLYHSLNNLHDQPDAVDALENVEARQTFVQATHARIRELITLYNPIDILWYDGWWPFNAEGWNAVAMNDMVRSIQPNILFNGRNGLTGDFATPEGHMSAPVPWRPWEACMTLNNSWGFHAGDHDWKTASQVIDLLTTAATGRGNLLLNVGPTGDGSIPIETTRVLTTIGDWIRHSGQSVFDTDLFTFDLQERGDHRSEWCNAGSFTASGKTMYLLARKWIGRELTLSGLECRVERVTLLNPRQELTFTQMHGKLRITGLPDSAPDPVCPVIRFDCDREPSMYLTGGIRTPRVPHPHYDPCPSDMQAGHKPG